MYVFLNERNTFNNYSKVIYLSIDIYLSRVKQKIRLLETSASSPFRFVSLNQKRDSTFAEITYEHVVTYRRTMTHTRPFHARIAAIKPLVKEQNSIV